MNGVILVNKCENYTSRDVVNVISKTLHIKRVGHTGTLDPMATGVLAVCVGEATKLVEILMCNDKEYVAEITLGIDTDTLDTTGHVLNKIDTHLSALEIDSVLEQMVGCYMQEVPKYSAVKVNGKKLYEYAREEIDVKLPSHEVSIFSLYRISEVTYENGLTKFKIKTEVSKGTYIRSLIRDIAIKLGTVGVMSSLVRTRQGSFTIDACNTLSEITSGNYKMYSIAEMLDFEYTVIVDEILESMIKNGRVLENRYDSNFVVFKNKKGNVLAIYKEKEDGMLHVFKMFHEE